MACQPCRNADRAGGRRIVAGNHHHANASRLAFSHSRRHFGPYRVCQTHETKILEVEPFGRLRKAGRGRVALLMPVSLGHGEHAEALRRQFIDGCAKLLHGGSVHTAETGYGFRCALGGH